MNNDLKNQLEENGLDETKKKSKGGSFLKLALGFLVISVMIVSCSPFNSTETTKEEPKEEVKIEEKVEKVEEVKEVAPVDPDKQAKSSYSNYMGDKFSKLSGEMQTFSSLMSNPSFYDDTWILNTAMSLYTIDTIADEVISYSPVPPDFQQLNDVTKEAMMEYKAMVEILPDAIDNLNVDGINRATEHLLIGNELINQVTVLTQELAQ